MRQTIEEENEGIFDLAKKMNQNSNIGPIWRENMSTCEQIIDTKN